VLSAAAVVAALGFKAGMIPILFACAAAGAVMHFAGLARRVILSRANGRCL